MSQSEEAFSDRPLETEPSAGMTDAELAEAKRYGRLELRCALADKAIDVAYLAAGGLPAWPAARCLVCKPARCWPATGRCG